MKLEEGFEDFKRARDRIFGPSGDAEIIPHRSPPAIRIAKIQERVAQANELLKTDPTVRLEDLP